MSRGGSGEVSSSLPMVRDLVDDVRLRHQPPPEQYSIVGSFANRAPP